MHSTVDWEIFMLKIICVKNFHGVKFLQFRSIREFFLLTVDGHNKDKRLEQPSIWSTTRYQESQVSLAVVVDWTFISGGMDFCTRLCIDTMHSIHSCCIGCSFSKRGNKQSEFQQWSKLLHCSGFSIKYQFAGLYWYSCTNIAVHVKHAHVPQNKYCPPLELVFGDTLALCCLLHSHKTVAPTAHWEKVLSQRSEFHL